MQSSKYPRVALLIDTATDWGRRMIRGIARYAQQQGGWDLWLERWIRDLPKPVAMLTWTGRRGRDVIYACRALGFSVPEQVAVLAAVVAYGHH